MIRHGRIHQTASARVWRFRCDVCGEEFGMRSDLLDDVKRTVWKLLAQHLMEKHGVFEPAIEVEEFKPRTSTTYAFTIIHDDPEAK